MDAAHARRPRPRRHLRGAHTGAYHATAPQALHDGRGEVLQLRGLLLLILSISHFTSLPFARCACTSGAHTGSAILAGCSYPQLRPSANDIPTVTQPALQILLDMGFEFGEVAQMTDEWENRFDQLLEWMLWNREEVRTLAGCHPRTSCDGHG